jgi:predicted nucleotidyltransferase
VKKYFYVLRPILACRWIEAGLGVVPMEFAKLVDGVALSPDLRGAIERLLADKLAGREMDDGPRVPMFHEFFDSEMARLERIVGEIPAGDTRDFEQLDALFRSAIGWTRTSTL